MFYLGIAVHVAFIQYLVSHISEKQKNLIKTGILSLQD